MRNGLRQMRSVVVVVDTSTEDNLVEDRGAKSVARMMRFQWLLFRASPVLGRDLFASRV
jgi:hypothetical protein